MTYTMSNREREVSRALAILIASAGVGAAECCELSILNCLSCSHLLAPIIQRLWEKRSDERRISPFTCAPA